MARAWEIKELFRYFWECGSVQGAKVFFEKWYARAIQCDLALVRKVARMIRKHLEHLLSCLVWNISNGVVED